MVPSLLPPGLAAPFALVAAALLLALLPWTVWLIARLLDQNRRLLQRVDSVERLLAERGATPVDDQEARDGLPLGTPAPPFSLPGVHGETMTLAALRAYGRPVLLVFSGPGCEPCTALLPDVGRWQREHAARLTVAVVTRGSTEANRDVAAGHGLGHLLLQRESEVADAYRSNGTPTGVVVRTDGTIGSVTATGSAAIRRLVAHVVSTPANFGSGPAESPPPETAGVGTDGGDAEPAVPAAAERDDPGLCPDCIEACEARGGGAACDTVCRMAGQCP